MATTKALFLVNFLLWVIAIYAFIPTTFLLNNHYKKIVYIQSKLQARSSSINYRNSQSSSTTSRKKSLSSPSNDLRKLKYARILRDELADIICSVDIRASRYPEGLLETVSIVDIELSNDLERAKIHISVMGNTVERKRVFVWLNENVGQVRYSLAQRLKNMKRVPNLVFSLVDRQSEYMLSDVMDEIATPSTPIAMEDVDFEEV
jgi:ribosome-binding factor A